MRLVGVACAPRHSLYSVSEIEEVEDCCHWCKWTTQLIGCSVTFDVM